MGQLNEVKDRHQGQCEVVHLGCNFGVGQMSVGKSGREDQIYTVRPAAVARNLSDIRGNVG